MPPEVFRYTGGARPDASGLVGHNRDGFKSPEFQRGAMHFMIRSLMRNDRQGVETAWTAIDAAFAHQTENGGFSQHGAPLGGPSALALWLASLDEAMLLLRESQFEPDFRQRIEQLIPKIHRAARWLAQPRYQNRLKRDDAEAPNRLLFDALAYGLSGLLADDPELQSIGRRFVDLAMEQFRPCDGVFLEKGGHDSSYQAVAARNLMLWTLYFPDEKLGAQADQAARWLRDRVGPDGQVDVAGNTRTGLGQEQWMGRDKDVNLSEITLCLLWHHALTEQKSSLDAARRIQKSRMTPQTPINSEN